MDDHIWREGFRHNGTGQAQDLRIPFRIGMHFVKKSPREVGMPRSSGLSLRP
jgi:hypothetical protein